MSSLPGGRWLFSRLLGWFVPYSGTIRPIVLELEPGHARVALPDRRRIRNHIRSVHAIAMVNVAELASGLAMLTALPPTLRGIVGGLSVEFVKKGRGTLIAECRCDPTTLAAGDITLDALVRDAGGNEVARARIQWVLGATKSG
ncbi:MAG: hotdog fold domain-containing protein [Gemmatimonadaceae bacterium]